MRRLRRAAASPRTCRMSSSPRSWNSGPQAGRIRQQEQGLLNFLGQDLFFKFGGAAAVVMIVALLVLAGPPPSDSRCTLPWC